MKFNPMAFIDNLSYMILGMTSILIVIILIIFITMAINKFTNNN